MENLLLICLILISVFDVKEKRIPNSLVVSIFLLGLIGLCAGRVSYAESIVGFVVLPLIMLLLSRVTGYKIGMGDIKLISAIGFCLGFWDQLFAILIGFGTCFVYLLSTLIKNKGREFRNTYILGPFISFGVLFTLIINKIIVK
ncbi:MAG: prepilin peptidase [Eubacterium sp.]|nr:prepilin peptidase [Eubacterium sp.]